MVKKWIHNTDMSGMYWVLVWPILGTILIFEAMTNMQWPSMVSDNMAGGIVDAWRKVIVCVEVVLMRHARLILSFLWIEYAASITKHN